MLFRRKTKTPFQLAYNQRVAAFWNWYKEQAERFYTTIEAGKCAELAKEVSQNTNHFLPGFAWVFGPGPKGQGGHSFTLSPEGNAHQRLLTEYWLALAPQLPGWTFYASRQASPNFGPQVAIEIKGRSFKAGEIWVTPHPQADTQLINLTAWHPAFAEIPHEAAYQLLFIMLDEALGEDAVEHHIGEIHLRDNKLAKSFPVHELNEEVERIRAHWDNPKPMGNYTVYRLPEPDNSFVRSDTIIGQTRHPKLIQDYLREAGRLKEDPFDGKGARFVFLAFDSASLPEGDEAIRRGEIEDALDNALKPQGLGEVLGGAIGHNQTYVDLLLYDPNDPTLEAIQETIAPFALRQPGLHAFFKCNGKPIHTFS